MAKQNDAGVYQKENGYWEYRFVVRIDGKRVCRKKCTDEHGNKFKTKREAIAAREAAIVALRIEKTTKPKPARRTVKEVFEEFCAEGRKDRAYQTIRKQDSLWENHLRDRFGNRYVDEISSAEVVDYLCELYYDDGLAYMYVESFLKMFYLIFGQAYSRNYLDVDTYNKLCVNKNTKIHMPKLKTDDDTDIVAFSKEECAKLDEYFKGTKADIYPTTYCGELFAPAFRKFVAVSNICDAEGQPVDDAEVKSFNEQNNLLQVINPTKTDVVRLEGLQAGYKYEIVYSAVDFSGKVVAKKYYLNVK